MYHCYIRLSSKRWLLSSCQLRGECTQWANELVSVWVIKLNESSLPCQRYTVQLAQQVIDEVNSSLVSAVTFQVVVNRVQLILGLNQRNLTRALRTSSNPQMRDHIEFGIETIATYKCIDNGLHVIKVKIMITVSLIVSSWAKFYRFQLENDCILARSIREVR